MTWVRTNRHYINLTNISVITFTDDYDQAIVYGESAGYLLTIDGEEAIALISAIDELGIKDCSYNDPVEDYGYEDSLIDEPDLSTIDTNSGISL